MDLVVEELVIVEFKTVEGFTAGPRSSVVILLKATGDVGWAFNQLSCPCFEGRDKADCPRVLRSLRLSVSAV
jgi:hypothetical protein